MFSVYILKSKIAEKYYIGQTVNTPKRLIWHNSSRARWTKRFQPWELIHEEIFKTRSEAMKKEKELKALKNIKRFIIQYLEHVESSPACSRQAQNGIGRPAESGISRSR